jgi:hypothetical protein
MQFVININVDRKNRLKQIAACDEDLARGDAQLATLCERFAALAELQETRLKRRDAMLRFLREP